jgi:regulator of ribosome biosynthesis
LDVSSLFNTLAKESREQGGDQAPVLDMDLGNLLVFNYQEQKKGFDTLKTTELCLQELFDQIFNLPVTPSDAGPLVELPFPTTKIPREKPPPKPKVPTKWEAFAKEKGIVKKKRSRMVYDEIAKEYRPRWGKDRPLDPKTDWVLPDKPGQLEEAGASDPFELNNMKKKQELKNKEVLNSRTGEELQGLRLEMSQSVCN